MLGDRGGGGGGGAPGEVPAVASGGVARRDAAAGGAGETKDCDTRLGLEPTSSRGCRLGPTLSRGLSPRWLNRARGVRCGVPATRRAEGSCFTSFILIQLSFSIFRASFEVLYHKEGQTAHSYDDGKVTEHGFQGQDGAR